MEKPIRVLVANHPRLMRELILTTFEDQPDLEVVGEVADQADIVEIVRKTLPDVLVISQEHSGKRPALCDEVLRENPGLRIVAVAPDKNYTVHYWVSLDIRSRDMEASEQGLLDALRGRKFD